ncbi:RING-H2 finger protein ATL79-like [Punica granatum]|uniref:RING-type E3 ubiquitin transferase n=2 Tax=Punica granatum TaxID=22663 RepID=A0A218WI57_PUNGR|nr:RING-H2 finger protein ATL79-like [Punica granatum]OWM72253.1 hypothetical protein CDL15_Pgr018138 [Punica granatum]PKI69487.1 hypothetical protein CRG98_010120 [Punica granatum]
MRPPPSVIVPAAAHTAVRVPLPEPPVGLDACDPRPCRWVPPVSRLSGSGDFEANAIVVLIVLLCALVCALALHAAIRCFLRGGSSQPQPQLPTNSTAPDQKPAVVLVPPVAYTEELGLAGADCAICLTEFEEGEAVRVLKRCRHGFHAECIERWLCSHASCPNCRSSCCAPAESSSCSSPAKTPSSDQPRERGEDCSRDGGEEPGSSSGQL